jgi:hypothetical protein
MTDIFISYAREDRARAARLANALEVTGWSVWWDRKIIAGQSFDEAIEHELEAAKRILVLWSKDSINSEWVRNEAAVAAERRVLVPALIDPVKLPLEFRRKQTIDLVDWDGDPAHEGFRALCDAMEVGSPLVRDEAAVPGPSPARSGSRSPWSRPRTLSILAALTMALGFGLYWGLMATNQHRTATDGRARPALADLVAGVYHGDVIADAEGSSMSDVTVTITKLTNRKVRITSDYERLGDVEVDLSRVGSTIQNAGGDSLLLIKKGEKSPELEYNPDGTVAFHGQKQ